jgi:hypothetical protein
MICLFYYWIIEEIFIFYAVLKAEYEENSSVPEVLEFLYYNITIIMFVKYKRPITYNLIKQFDKFKVSIII